MGYSAWYIPGPQAARIGSGAVPAAKPTVVHGEVNVSDNIFLPAGVEVRYDVKAEMRDGVRLSADIYFPKGQSGPFPVVLNRTPYDNMYWGGDTAIFFVQHGYVYMTQDTRGRFDSEGDYYPWVKEFEDGHDTVEWIGSQSWCDGNVGMTGPSYLGNVQWMAAAMGSNYLKTIVPEVIGDNLHDAPHYQGGAFQLSLNTTWAFSVSARTRQLVDRYNWEQVFHLLPLKDLPRMAGKDIPFYQDWLEHPDYDDYWKALAVDRRYGDVKVPVLQIGGWYDTFSAGAFENFVGMRERGGSALARETQKVLVGPWVHTTVTTDVTNAGTVDYGNDSVVDFNDVKLRWFDRWLKGVSNGADRDAPLRIFVMGANEWRDEHEWPLARAEFTAFYLHSGGSANSLVGDGALSTKPPTDEPADRYVYDPRFPTPTGGGGTCCYPEYTPWGAHDQRQIEFRHDVLVYTTDPLEQDLEVTGPIVAKIVASTDATDTDFTAKLVDVYPDGYAINLCDGIIRGRYRETTAEQRLLEPGSVYEFTVELGPTANVFLAGHSIRLEISSSNFPRFDRNPNTGHKFAEDAEMQVANQQVFHDGARSSHVLLPVVPR